MTAPLVVNLYPTYAEVKLDNVLKPVTYSDLLGAISEHAEGMMQAVNATPFIMPDNVLKFSVGANDMNIVMYYKEQIGTCKMQMTRNGTRPEDNRFEDFTIPMPNIVIDMHFKRNNNTWVASGVFYYATSLGPDNISIMSSCRDGLADRDLCLLPCSNLYEDGRMCYGYNTMPSGLGYNLRSLNYYYRVLFDSPGNNDLRVRGLNRHNEGLENIFSYLNALKQLKEYPYQILNLRTVAGAKL